MADWPFFHRAKPYDMLEIIGRIVDDSEFDPYKEFYGRCQRFDTAISGFGGCLMAVDELVGNMPTDRLLDFLQEKGFPTRVSESTIKKLELSFQQLIGN